MTATSASETILEPGFPDANPGVSVVIPVFNEVGNLRPLAQELVNVQGNPKYQYEVIWVNDGSTDGSGEVLEAIAEYERHRVIHLRRNSGQSAALAAGIDHATGEIICPMDGDGQNDPADIPLLVEHLRNEGLDCVSGVRQNRSDPLAKRVPSRVQTALTRQMCPEAGSDMGCTLKAYRADALADIDLRGEHHRYIPAKLSARGYALDERPVNHRERQAGQSHYGAGRLLRGFLDALYHLLLTRWGARPIHLFGAVGIGMLSVGLLLGSHMLLERLVLQNPIGGHVPRLILIALLVIAGLLVTALGFLSELLTRLLYQDEPPYRVEEVVE